MQDIYLTIEDQIEYFEMADGSVYYKDAKPSLRNIKQQTELDQKCERIWTYYPKINLCWVGDLFMEEEHRQVSTDSTEFMLMLLRARPLTDPA